MGKHIPQCVREVAEVIGLRETVLLGQVAHHRQIYVPSRKLDPDHPLAKALGNDKARELQRAFGGCAIYMPRFRTVRTKSRDRRILALVQAGMVPSAVARQLGVCERTVARALARSRKCDNPSQICKMRRKRVGPSEGGLCG